MRRVRVTMSSRNLVLEDVYMSAGPEFGRAVEFHDAEGTPVYKTCECAVINRHPEGYNPRAEPSWGPAGTLLACRGVDEWGVTEYIAIVLDDA